MFWHKTPRADEALLKQGQSLLESAGYKVTAVAKKATVITHIDGKPSMGSLEADLIAEKNKKKFVVIIKSGQAADATEPLIRRQLLELAHVFKPKGLLLVDLTKAEVHEISFTFPQEPRELFIKIVLVLFIIAAVIGMIWLMAQLKFI